MPSAVRGHQAGLLPPLVLDGDGRVLDGTAPLPAELASVEPILTTYDHDDPDGYALAVNIMSRKSNTGGEAIVAAQAARLRGPRSREAAERYNSYHSLPSSAGLVLD